MTEKQSFLSDLNKSERIVHDYIKKECEKTDGRMRESMNDIGKKLNISEATVYRAIRKLNRIGVVGIIPSTGKAKSNEMIYYGEPDQEKQVEEIFELANDLNSNMKRLETLLSQKDHRINMLERERDRLMNHIESIEKELENSSDLNNKLKSIISEYEKGNLLFKDFTIDDLIELKDGKKALIFTII